MASGTGSVFTRYEKINKVCALAVNTDGSLICRKEIKGQYPANLKKHLRHLKNAAWGT